MDPAEARALIIARTLRGEALRAALLAVPPADRDRWLDDVLGLPAPLPDGELPPGAVPYLPASVADILAFVDEVPLSPAAEVVDLGAGLGRVLVLAHLLSGARAHGIEIQPHLAQHARRTVDAFGLSGITITCADAAETALDGSVFFLYAPFNGALLSRVCERIAVVARRRPIVVATVDLPLPDLPWLVSRPSRRPSLAIYASQPP